MTRIRTNPPADPSTPVVSRRFSWAWQRYPDAESMSVAAAAWVAQELHAKPDLLISLATGASPRRAYELLVDRARSEPALFARARWIKLDEWGGLAMNDPASCETFLREVLLDPIGVAPERYFGWESRPADVEAECSRVAGWLAANGPIDVQILGLGENGHLGFNEPAPELQSGPHRAQLSPVSLSHAMLGRSRNRVAYGLTLGMDDILNSRRILLLVSGARKAQQLLRLFAGGVTNEFPASWLQRHSDVVIFCDAAAASLVDRELLSGAGRRRPSGPSTASRPIPPS